MTDMNEQESQQYQTLVTALKAADWDAFHAVRFEIAEEGWYFTLRDLDLSGLDLRGLPARFLAFERCNFSHSSLVSADLFPASFKDCNMEGVDLTAVRGICYMWNCDLRGAKYDNSTLFWDKRRSDEPSQLEGCQLDEDFRSFLIKQGVHFELTGNHRISEFPDTR